MNGFKRLMERDAPSARAFFQLIKGKLKAKVAPITRVETDEPFVAITFDDGPHPLYTPILLDVFRQFQARGTFFMVGQEALKHRWIVKETANGGHEIGNHTMDHLSMSSIGRRERWRQIRMCRKALSPYGNRYFRPPYGEQSGWTNIDAMMLGYELIGWSLDVADWWNNDLTSMYDTIQQNITNGSIILFHDSIYDQGNPKHKIVDERANLNRHGMIDLVRMVLENFRGRFQFVPINELLKHGKAERCPLT